MGQKRYCRRRVRRRRDAMGGGPECRDLHEVLLELEHGLDDGTAGLVIGHLLCGSGAELTCADVLASRSRAVAEHWRELAVDEVRTLRVDGGCEGTAVGGVGDCHTDTGENK